MNLGVVMGIALVSIPIIAIIYLYIRFIYIRTISIYKVMPVISRFLWAPFVFISLIGSSKLIFGLFKAKWSNDSYAVLLFAILAIGVPWFIANWWYKQRAETYEMLPENASSHNKGTEVVDASVMKKGMRQSKIKLNQKDIEIGGLFVPQEFETQHFLISGTTGSGKTQSIYRFLTAIKARNEKALIADPAGGFYSRFGGQNDLIFNPFDKRSVAWSPFAEIKNDYDCQRLAKAAIPDGTGEGAEWHHYAQTLLAETLLAMFHQGNHSIKKLLYYVSSAPIPELSELLSNSPAAILTAKGNDKMLNNTRGILTTYISVWRYLQDVGTFSVRDWVRNNEQSNWLFVTYRDDQMGMLKNLVSSMLELGIVECLSLSEAASRALWFVCDEVDSLGKVTSLRAGLTKLRKYGGRVVLGLQTISQLRETYGKDEAQTLLANCSVKLMLRAGDNETADYFSKEIGEQEITQAQISGNTGSSSGQASSTSSGSSVTYQNVRQMAVMGSEILALDNLKGYLKMPTFPVAKVVLTYKNMPEINQPFVG